MSHKIIKNMPRNLLIMAALIFVTFKYIIKGISRKDIFLAVKGANIYLLAVGVVLSLMYVMCEAFNTNVMLKSYGYETNIIKTSKYAFSGCFFSGLTPSATGGQPMQIFIMKQDGIKISHSSLIMMVELCVYQIVTIFMAIIGFLHNYKYIFESRGINAFIIFAGITINTIVLLFIFFAVVSEDFVSIIRKISYFFIDRIKFIKNKEKNRETVDKGLKEYRKSSLFIKENKIMMVKIFISTIVQVLSLYSISYVVYRCLGYNSIPYRRIVFLQALVSVSGSSMPLPGAIGVSEKLFVFLFSGIYANAILNKALILTRGTNFYVLFMISAVIFFLSFGRYIYLGKEELKNG